MKKKNPKSRNTETLKKKIETLKIKIAEEEKLEIYPPRFHVSIIKQAALQRKDLNFNVKVMNADPEINFHVVPVTGIEHSTTCIIFSEHLFKYVQLQGCN